MCFNFTQNFQFPSRVTMCGEQLPIVRQNKLLGVIITTDMKWNKNTKYLRRKGNARIKCLRKLTPFSPPIENLKTIYKSYIRSVLEESCTVWHSDLTENYRISLERVQKNASRNILQDKYEGYISALRYLNMETL